MQSTLNNEQIQRRLILVRHAKAMEDHPAGDHARGLSERGLADAESLGKWLEKQGITPDAALCSTAARTRETLHQLGNNIPTILSDKIYLASTNDMLAQVQQTDDAVKTLLLVAHNPGSHALLGLLVGECVNDADADKMLLKFPTAACAVMEFDIRSWKDVAPQAGRLSLLRY